MMWDCMPSVVLQVYPVLCCQDQSIDDLVELGIHVKRHQLLVSNVLIEARLTHESVGPAAWAGAEPVTPSATAWSSLTA